MSDLDILLVVEDDGTNVVRLHGELDVASAVWLRDALDAACHSLGTVLVLDLADLEFCDAAGLGVFAEYHERGEHDGCKLLLRSVPDHVRRLLTITGLVDVVHLTE